MGHFLYTSFLGNAGQGVSASAPSYDDILASEIGTGTAGAAERTIPDGVTNLTLTSSDLQGATAGNVLRLQFGFNDGVSTTWYTTSGDYRRNLESDLSNSGTDRDDIHVAEDLAPNATITRPHAWSFSADCLHLAAPTTTVGCEYFNDSSPGSSNDGAFLTHVMTDAVVINRFRVFYPGTTGSSGSIRVKYETRPVELIEATDITGLANTHAVDVTGYSSVRLVSTDMVVSAVSGGLAIRTSTDGVSYAASSGDYRWTQENGNGSSNSTTATELVPDGTTSASKGFTMEILNLDAAAPTISYASSMNVASAQPRFWSMRQAAEVNTHLQLKLPGATTGVSGTLYWIGDATPSVLIASTAMTSYTDPGTLAANPAPVVSHSVASYGRISACAFTATTAAATQVHARISDDSGVSFEAAGYSSKVEDGGDEAQRSEYPGYAISTATAGTSTTAAFMMFAENVNLEAPMFGWGAQFAVNGKASSMVKANTPVTDFGVMFWDAASTDHVAGSTGTVYLVGRE